MRATAMGMLEREHELARIERALDVCAGERGATVLVRGLPGIGKTALLEAGVRLAQERGFAIARARGEELERELGFAVVHQLLVSPAVRPHAEALATESAGSPLGALIDPTTKAAAPDELSLLHALWSVLADAAAGGPIVLVVDDAHLADVPSLRFAGFLARRISGLPALLLIAARPAADELLESIAEAADVLEPGPLSADAVRALVREAFGAEPAEAFVAACREISGGNPFYLNEVLLAARGKELQPLERDAGVLAGLGSERVGQAVLGRCRGAGEEAIAVAQAMAVLGPDAALPHIAAVAGLDADATARACDGLADAHVLAGRQPPAFLHPVLRSSLLDAIGQERRLGLHSRAADELARAGLPLERIVVHLLAIPPRLRQEDAAVLREVAAREASRCSPRSAIRLLRRALAEPLDDQQRAAVELELARHEANVGDAEAGARLTRLAISPHLTSGERAEAAAILAQYATEHRGPDDVRDALRLLEAADGLDADTRLMYKAMSLLYMLYGYQPMSAADREWAARVAAMATSGSSAGSRAASLLRAVFASADLPAARVAELCEQALARGALIDDRPWGVAAGSICGNWLVSFGRFDAAREIARRFRDVARTTGSTWARHGEHEILAKIAWYEGDLAAVDAYSMPIAERSGGSQLHYAHTLRSVRVAIERGEIQEAERRLSLAPDAGGSALSSTLAAATAWLRLAQQRYPEAIKAADGADPARHVTWAMPAQTDDHARWVAALARYALGDRVGARAAANEAVAVARRLDEDRRVGAALRVAAAVSERAEALVGLEEAIARLERTPARLELAYALVDFGVLVRTGGRRVDARDPLRRGLDLAVHCGATVLAERAREELALAGAKPRRDVITGRDALTPAESRVAQLAAQGWANREIAQTLFLSVRTVEAHLWRVYVKLGITSRAELPIALSPAADPDHARGDGKT